MRATYILEYRRKATARGGEEELAAHDSDEDNLGEGGGDLSNEEDKPEDEEPAVTADDGVAEEGDGNGEATAKETEEDAGPGNGGGDDDTGDGDDDTDGGCKRPAKQDLNPQSKKKIRSLARAFAALSKQDLVEVRPHMRKRTPKNIAKSLRKLAK